MPETNCRFPDAQFTRRSPAALLGTRANLSRMCRVATSAGPGLAVSRPTIISVVDVRSAPRLGGHKTIPLTSSPVTSVGVQTDMTVRLTISPYMQALA